MQIELKLTEEQERVLTKIANEEGVSIAELVQKNLETYVRAKGQLDQEELSLEEKQRRALSIMGRYSSGKHDISEEHDRYLAEIYEENIG